MLDEIVLETYPAGGGTRTTTLHNVTSQSRQVARAQGLYGWSAPREARRDRTEQHGSWDRSRWLSGKTVSLEGEVWASTIQAAFTEMDMIEQAALETLPRPGLLKWRRANAGLALQAYVKLAGEPQPPLEEGAPMLRYPLQLFQLDARAYSQALSSYVGGELAAAGGGLTFPFTFPILFGPSGGGVANVQNNGIADTPPIIRLYGPVTSPRVQLQTTGEQVVIEGQIGSGDYLELDHAARLVRLNGQTKRMNLLDSEQSTFYDVPPGAHVVRVLASSWSAGAHGEVDLRDAYAG